MGYCFGGGSQGASSRAVTACRLCSAIWARGCMDKNKFVYILGWCIKFSGGSVVFIHHHRVAIGCLAAVILDKMRPPSARITTWQVLSFGAGMQWRPHVGAVARMTLSFSMAAWWWCIFPWAQNQLGLPRICLSRVAFHSPK